MDEERGGGVVQGGMMMHGGYEGEVGEGECFRVLASSKVFSGQRLEWNG